MSEILIVEDEAHLAAGLRFNLEAEGDVVTVAATGERALELLHAGAGGAARFDLVVLDVMLPGIDGFTVAAELRAARCYVPILMLTARGEADDVLRGFAAGADDYLAKPFELAILRARIRGLLRRQSWHAGPDTAPGNAAAADVFEFDGRRVDFGNLELRVGERRLPLTLMEANLLRYLIVHRGEAVSRKAILEQVWGVAGEADTRAIDNFVVRLRKYIEDEPARPRYLTTVRGVGYRFSSSPSA